MKYREFERNYTKIKVEHKPVSRFNLPAAAPKRELLDISSPRSVMESPRSFKSVSSASSVTFAVTDDKSVKVEDTVF